jgi:hypothetical protein
MRGNRRGKLCVTSSSLLLVVLFGVAGCGKTCLCPSGLCLNLQSLACRRTQPSPLPPAIKQSAASQSAIASDLNREYCELTPQECRWLAASFAPAAKRRNVDCTIAADAACRHHCWEHGNTAAPALQRDLLLLEIDEQRDLASAEALESFFRLFEAEQDIIQLQQGLRETEAMQTFVETAQPQENAPPIDKTLPKRRKLELQRQMAEADMLCLQLNNRLRLLLGLDTADPARICPATDLLISGTTINVDEAVNKGLAQRYDLGKLRLLVERLDCDTLPVIRAVLSQVDGTLMIAPTGLKDLKSSRDLCLRREQLEHLLAQRERAASVEITEAAATVDAHVRQARLATSYLQNWQERQADLERQQGAGRITKLDIGMARLDVNAARIALIHEVVAWKIGLVKLAAAQGCLAAEDNTYCPDRPVPPEREPAVLPAVSVKPTTLVIRR